MNITREDRENRTAVIKVVVDEPDYRGEADKKLREYRRKVNIPGFRPGMVPMSIVTKLYGKSAVAEASYKVASEACGKYVEQEKIDIMADIMPSPEQGAFDFENNTTHEFMFELGLAPQIDLNLSKDDKVVRYHIAADKDMKESYKSNFMRNFGSMVDAECVSSDEALEARLENGEITVEQAYIGLVSMTEQDRAPFIGKKVGDQMIVNINELYKNRSQRAAILKLKDEELDAVAPEFNLTLTSVRKFQVPEADENFFRIAFPEGDVKNSDEFEAFIAAKVEEELQKESDSIFMSDIRKYLLDKANPVLPEAFLRNWLIEINQGKYTAEQVDQDFPSFCDMMRWNAVQKHFIKQYDIKIEQDDVMAQARKIAAMQLAQYGIQKPADDMVDDFAKRMLGDEGQQNRVLEMAYDEKVVAAVSPVMDIEVKDVDMKQLSEIMAKRAE